MGAASQYATTGHVNWGWKGVAGAAVAGGVGAIVGMGVGGLAAAALGPYGGAALGGASGGATAGGLGTGLAGGNWNDVGKSMLTGAVAGAIGGGVGVYAGTTSANGWIAFGGTMVGTGAGTASGIGIGAAFWGDAPTWQSAGIAFASAFGGAIASTALSKGVQQMAEDQTSGEAAGTAAGKAAKRSYEVQREGQREMAERGESSGRTTRFTSALLDAAGGKSKVTEMTCAYVRCVDASIAPADVVGRARGYAFIGGHASELLGHEVGTVDVRTTSGDITTRTAVPVGESGISFNVTESGDTPLQYNHSHVPGMHSEIPTNFDAWVVVSHPGTAITTFLPTNDTINIMWRTQSGEMVQTNVAKYW